MEEKKISLPKPPKALVQSQENKVEKVENLEKNEIAFPEIDKKSEIDLEAEPEFEPKVDEEKSESIKKKFNFEPMTNWVGLFVSLLILGVFIFLLVIN